MKRPGMGDYRLLVLGAAIVAGAALAGAKGLEPGRSSESASSQVRQETEFAAVQRSGHHESGIAPGVIDQDSLRHRGTFKALHGGDFAVYEGELLPGSPLNGPGKVDPIEGARKKCVILRGHGFVTLACAHDPLATSTMLFGESSSGGPEGRARTEFQIAGFTSPEVARILAVDSNGRTRDARMSPSHAFFVELPGRELREGVTIRSLRAYSASGDLLEDVDA